MVAARRGGEIVEKMVREKGYGGLIGDNGGLANNNINHLPVTVEIVLKTLGQENLNALITC